MKKYLLLFVLTTLSYSSYAQPDSSLLNRLHRFLNLNHLKDFNGVLDYTYPKLFTIVPREQMLEIMKNAFDNEEMVIEVDSLQTVKFYPLLTTDEGSFLKIDYSMILRMQYKKMEEDSSATPEKMEQISSLLSTKYGEGNARYDAASKKIIIRVHTPLLAIRDILSPEWTFINFKNDEMITPLLLSQDIIDKINSQQ